MLFKNKYRAESARLKNWDYSWDGYYYITVCTKDRRCLLSEIKDNNIFLSNIGKIAEKYWVEIPKHFPFVKLDDYIIMPNHIHGIIIIENNDINIRRDKALPCLYMNNNMKNINNTVNRCQNQGKNTISSIIGSYKSICTKQINISQDKTIFAWQKGFYDHIIRDINDLNNIKKYIRYNYLKWDCDEENPDYYPKN